MFGDRRILTLEAPQYLQSAMYTHGFSWVLPFLWLTCVIMSTRCKSQIVSMTRSIDCIKLEFLDSKFCSIFAGSSNDPPLIQLEFVMEYIHCVCPLGSMAQEIMDDIQPMNHKVREKMKRKKRLEKVQSLLILWNTE